MEISELEAQIQAIRRRPLLILCRSKEGKDRVMTVKQCLEAGAAFLYVVNDDLDVLLERALGHKRPL